MMNIFTYFISFLVSSFIYVEFLTCLLFNNDNNGQKLRNKIVCFCFPFFITFVEFAALTEIKRKLLY